MNIPPGYRILIIDQFGNASVYAAAVIDRPMAMADLVDGSRQ